MTSDTTFLLTRIAELEEALAKEQANHADTRKHCLALEATLARLRRDKVWLTAQLAELEKGA
jgi:ribosome-interacting GTPase 1